MTTERQAAITLKGNPMTLVGDELRVGDTAPDFKLKGADMSDKTLADFDGKIKLLSCVPSLDTPTCDTETRRFNEEAKKIGDDVVVLTVSMDLPPAQKRWCGAHDVEHVVVMSDYLTHQFGIDYGVRIKEIGFLARCIFVLDRENKVRYVQLVGEVADEPDYGAALAAAREAAG